MANAITNTGRLKELFDLIRTLSNAIRTVGVSEDFVSRGFAYTHSDYYSFGASEVKEFIFDPTNYIPSIAGFNKIVTLVPIFDATGGPITIDIHANVKAANDGTLLTVFNRDGTSSNQAQVKARLNPTISDPGQKFSGILVPAVSQGAISSAGSTNAQLPFVLDITKKYMLKMTNLNGAGIYLGFRIIWFEI